jgi:predicted nuclease with TOPRIM domain
MSDRLTEKTSGVFKYDLKDFKHKVGEFNDYDAFFAYNMAVKKLGEYEDEHESLKAELERLKHENARLEEEYLDQVEILLDDKKQLKLEIAILREKLRKCIT